MNPFENKNICKVENFDVSTLVDEKLPEQKGIVVLPERHGHAKQLAVVADAGDFVKWVKRNSDGISISQPKETKKLLLRSIDIFLPLVFLASDIALPVYLNLVASYLYDKTRGNLKNDSDNIRFSAVYKSEKDGVLKKFEFSGNGEALKKTIKKFDLNEFLDD